MKHFDTTIFPEIFEAAFTRSKETGLQLSITTGSDYHFFKFAKRRLINFADNAEDAVKKLESKHRFVGYHLAERGIHHTGHDHPEMIPADWRSEILEVYAQAETCLDQYPENASIQKTARDALAFSKNFVSKERQFAIINALSMLKNSEFKENKTQFAAQENTVVNATYGSLSPVISAA